jgi:dihydroorotate dehydrogenase
MLYTIARPLLFRMEVEDAHDLALRIASRMPRVVASLWRPDSTPILEQFIHGVKFSHPLGLAAGVDKDGVAIRFWEDVGFSFMELGTVTPGGQGGNPQPRMFRDRNRLALINRMGFNNKGAAQLAEQLDENRPRIPYGVSIGKAKDTAIEHAAVDYAACAHTVFDKVVPSYFAINVSSPNTTNLRMLQTVDGLRAIVDRVRMQAPNVPIAIKLSPDLLDNEVRTLASYALEAGLAYVIATNTTIWHPHKESIGGGESGRPLLARAEAVTRTLFQVLGRRVPIIGVGGIDTAEAAYHRIRCGASLLQVYTGLVYRGPGLVREIVEGLNDRLFREETTIESQIGVDA